MYSFDSSDSSEYETTEYFDNDENKNDYQKINRELFNKRIVKKYIHVNTHNINLTDIDTSNYIYNFSSSSTLSNEINYNNVIGVNLIRAHIPTLGYIVNDTNNKIIYTRNGVSESATLISGNYTYTNLAIVKSILN